MSGNQQNLRSPDQLYRAIFILWAALLMSVAFYFAFSLVIPRTAEPENQLVTIVLSAVSAFAVVVSFLVKKKYFARSVESQDVRLVRVGLVVAAALCEFGALLGLLDLFVAHGRYYFVLMGFSFLGLLLHFPKRSDVDAASFKTPRNLS